MDNTKQQIIITGVAGFIGFHTALQLLQRGFSVVGVDNLNSYYEVSLKEARLNLLRAQADFRFCHTDIADHAAIQSLFQEIKPAYVIHLAAQAGVRYSLDHPMAYAASNLTGFVSILEACRHSRVQHLLYASSSSVYGEREKVPFSTDEPADRPISLYAATKRSNELMAYSYSHLFGLPTTGLRFFTAYGPWGRPDMAYFSFTKAIVEGRPIPVYDNGKGVRDFTYVDDIVTGVIACLLHSQPPQQGVPYRLYNIGSGKATNVLQMITWLEEIIGKKAKVQFQPVQGGDVSRTLADIGPIAADFGYAPQTPLREGLARFFAWYREYYGG